MRGLAAVLLCLMLASCGQVPPAQVPASSTPTSETSTPSVPAPLPPSSTSLPVPTTPGLFPTPSRALEPGVTTVRGTISGGVESGCTILATGSEQYLLLGADTAIAVAGAVVEVTGRADPGAMTTCQQGTPFHVASTRRG
jgi:hypothetical protein